PRHIGGGDNRTLVTLSADGRVQLTTGVPDAGSGIHTAMRQIAAEVLTIPPEWIEIRLGSTDVAPPDPGIGGARHMPTAGQGTHRGATELFERMRGFLAEERGWQEDRIVLQEGQFLLEEGDRAPLPDDAAQTRPARGEPVEPRAIS